MTTGSRKRFRVWLGSRDRSSRLRVEGTENTRWLIEQLSHSFAFKSCEPVADDPSGDCTFTVPYNSLVSASGLQRLLRSMPEVSLALETPQALLAISDYGATM
jgi:hypothetical protein